MKDTNYQNDSREKIYTALSIKEIWYIKNLTKKNPGPDDFSAELYQTLKVHQIYINSEKIQKANISHFLKLALPQYQNQRQQQKTKTISQFLMNRQILNKILGNQNT